MLLGLNMRDMRYVEMSVCNTKHAQCRAVHVRLCLLAVCDSHLLFCVLQELCAHIAIRAQDVGSSAVTARFA